MKRSLIGAAALALAACGTMAPGATTSSDSSAASLYSPVADGQVKLLANQVDPARQKANIEKMVSFGTRHTLSVDTGDTRGVQAAKRWAASEFEKLKLECKGCLTIVTPSETFTGQRVPQLTAIGDVVAIMKGTSDPDRVIIIQGHLDSMRTDVMDSTGDAPGANDDASGVAAVLETARILSKEKFAATLVFGVLTGEEQGLYGGQVMAHYAKSQGWKVEAVLNNDIVGNSHGYGLNVNDQVRIFSEGVRTAETDAQKAERIVRGGELDSPSRQIARYIHALVGRTMPGFTARMIYRRDRFGRSGDQVPALEQGFPAVRVTEATENYTRQHQNVRTEGGVNYGDVVSGVDFDYLAKVTKMNLMTMASLARAPMPPLEVKVERGPSASANISWTAVPGADHYVVWMRDTLEPTWTRGRIVAATETKTAFENTIIDDWFFGVSAVNASGYASPVQFAGPVGAFQPPPPPRQPTSP